MIKSVLDDKMFLSIRDLFFCSRMIFCLFQSCGTVFIQHVGFFVVAGTVI